jgi:archaeosortase A (PGF-CTERM-specific)
MFESLTDALAWVVVALFGIGAVLQFRARREPARYVTAFAWAVFAVFWLALVPHFAFVQKSIIEGILSFLAVPACLYGGLLLFRGRESLFTLSRAVAVMGLLYLPLESVVFLNRPLIEMVTQQTAALLSLLGYELEITSIGGELPYHNTLTLAGPPGTPPRSTEVVLACTGLGSITIFAGLVAAVEAPLRRKLEALAIVVPIIYVLNVVRVAFIAVAYGHQWFTVEPIVSPVLFLFGSTDPGMVSYFVADRILAQSLSVVALLALLWIVVRVLPELFDVLEDVAYLATGNEYDLRSMASGSSAD